MLPRACLLLPALLAHAQDPWEPVAALVKAQRAPDQFILVTPWPGLGFSWYGADPLAESHGRELMLLGAPRDSAALAALRGGWALYAPSGARLAEGSGQPRPAAVRERMFGDGWRPQSEGLETHLRAHPEDGQAWLEHAFQLARQARDATYGGTLTPAWRVRLVEGLQGALRKLAEMPGAERTWRERRPQPFAPLLAALVVARLDTDLEVGPLVQRLQRMVLDVLEEDPEAENLWAAAPFTRSDGAGDKQLPLRQLLEKTEPVPGRPWPPTGVAGHVESALQDDPSALTRIATEALDRTLSRDARGEGGPEERIRALAAWGGQQVAGFLRQAKEDEALQALEGLQRLAGRAWPRLHDDLEFALSRWIIWENAEHDAASPGARLRSDRLRAILDAPPLPDPPRPLSMPLRLALLGGTPDDRLAWGTLQIDPVFDSWDPNELNWKPASRDEGDRLRARHGWNAAPRWVLLQGDQLLATGEGLPRATTLQTALRTQATPSLERVGTFLKRHPERLDARRERCERLRPRLPHLRLETLFAEDLEAGLLPIGDLPFTPSTEAWAAPARRVCDRLRDLLGHWPFHEGLWRAYADWSALAPKAASPADLLGSLEPWPHQLGQRLPGPLPVASSLAVARRLEAHSRWGELDAWMRQLWERGLKDWVRRWSALGSGKAPEGAPAFLDRAAPGVKQLFAAWVRALHALGKGSSMEDLRQELAGLRRDLPTLLIGGK